VITCLLVDQNVIVPCLILIGKVLLDLPQTGALLKELPFYRQLLALGDFSLPDHRHQFSRLFKLLSELFEFFSTVSISTTSLPDLPDLTSSETNVRISIVSVGASLELQRGQQILTKKYRRQWLTLRLVIRELLPVANRLLFQCS